MAAAGRRIAVVSDDPRFDRTPVGITGPHGPVQISLYAAWEPAHHGSATISSLAHRPSEFCIARYGPQVPPTSSSARRQA